MSNMSLGLGIKKNLNSFNNTVIVSFVIIKF